MGSTSQLYSLTWGEFGTSLISAVQLLRCHGDMVDVTLAAGGRSFPAHKIVLGAASPFLLKLLKSTPCKHPVVLLAGVAANDLEALLEFVYRGEVSVDPNQLPSLLQAAHCLNIQGLAQGPLGSEKSDDAGTGSEALTRDVINSFLPLRRRKRAKRRSSTDGGSGSEGKWARGEENRPCEGEGEGAGPADVATPPAKTEDASEEQDDAGSKRNSVSDQPATCPLCGATLKQSRNLRRHLELLHFGAGRPDVRVRTRKSRSTPSNPDSPSPPPSLPDKPVALDTSTLRGTTSIARSQAGLQSDLRSSPGTPISRPQTGLQSDHHSSPLTLISRPEMQRSQAGQQSDLRGSPGTPISRSEMQPNGHTSSTIPISQHNVISQSLSSIPISHHNIIPQSIPPISIPQHNVTGHGNNVHGLSQHNPMSQHLLPMNHLTHMSGPHSHPHLAHHGLPPPHDALFRQHPHPHPHADHLRGAGLYADTSSEARSSSRQEVS